MSPLAGSGLKGYYFGQIDACTKDVACSIARPSHSVLYTKKWLERGNKTRKYASMVL